MGKRKGKIFGENEIVRDGRGKRSMEVKTGRGCPLEFILTRQNNLLEGVVIEKSKMWSTKIR